MSYLALEPSLLRLHAAACGQPAQPEQECLPFFFQMTAATDTASTTPMHTVTMIISQAPIFMPSF